MMWAVQNLIKGQTENLTGITEMKQICEFNRLKTLNNWSMENPSAKKIAEAGFYMPDEDNPGVVKCFSCFIELDSWEPTDDPWEEHKKRGLVVNPKCKYIEIGKKESELTVNDSLEIMKSFMLRVMQSLYNMNINKTLVSYEKKKSDLEMGLKRN